MKFRVEVGTFVVEADDEAGALKAARKFLATAQLGCQEGELQIEIDDEEE